MKYRINNLNLYKTKKEKETIIIEAPYHAFGYNSKKCYF